MMMRLFLWLMTILTLSACDAIADFSGAVSAVIPEREGEIGQVTYVVDGDTIDVRLADGEVYRVRYIGMNTPERGEPCHSEAAAANRGLVAGREVRLARDVSDTDRYGRLLRYVYAEGVLVNRALVEAGYAEAVVYQPDDAFYEDFRRLEQAAAQAQRGCHPTGIFDDGSAAR